MVTRRWELGGLSRTSCRTELGSYGGPKRRRGCRKARRTRWGGGRRLVPSLEVDHRATLRPALVAGAVGSGRPAGSVETFSRFARGEEDYEDAK